MLALGLDPSLRSFGYAIVDTEAPPQKRRVASGHEGTLSLQVPVARFIHFREMIRGLLQKYEVDVVGIESPAYGGGVFSEHHFGLMMFSLEAVFEKRKDCVLFDPTTLKFLTGKATSTKMDMQRFVQLDTMSPSIIQNDEADGYCIARFAARFILTRDGKLPTADLSTNEQKVFLTRSRKLKSATGVNIQKRTAHVFRENSRFFSFSKVPSGNILLPSKSQIDPKLLAWLDAD